MDALAEAYWAAPPYDEHDHGAGFEKHPFDMLQDLQLDATDQDLTRMLRSLALTAPTEKQLFSIGSLWVSALEYKFDAEGDSGKSLRLLVAAALEPNTLFRVLAGVDAGWLRSMGAEAILADRLSSQQLAELL